MWRIPTHSAALAVVLTSTAYAQSTTPEPEELFPGEASILRDGSVPAAPDGFGFEAAYDGMAGELPADPGGEWSTWDPDGPPVFLAFDPADVTILPFGLASLSDPEILHFLQYYATEGRRRMANWIARSGRYRALVGAELAAQGAPPELLWVAAVESDFTMTARSRAGAVGIYQFMPQTGRSMGLRSDREIDARRDPSLAARAAARYFVELQGGLGTWPLALAAYNAGQGHVRGGLRAANLTDFWELDDYQALFGDCRRYALRVMALATIDANRAAFGFGEVVEDDPWAFDVVDVPGGTRLSVVAQAAGVRAADLAPLNPALVGMRTPAGEIWPVRLPPGARDRFLDAFDQTRAASGDEQTIVAVRFGETIDEVASRFETTARTLRAINGLAPSDPVPYGAEIIVPGRARTSSPTAERVTVVVPQTRFLFADRLRVFYRASPGDTLFAVARHFRVDANHLAAWNDLDPNAALLSGLILQVFVAPELDLTTTRHWREEDVVVIPVGSDEWTALRGGEEPAAASGRRTYRVQRGDTPGEIASRFGIRVSDLARWNGLDADMTIVIGDELVVAR